MKTIVVIITLCSTIFAAVVYDLDIGDKCGPNNENECVLVTACSETSEQLKRGRTRNWERCGFQGGTEIVCCERNKLKARDPVRYTPAVAACESYSELYTTKKKPFIINGANASLGDFPYIASLHIKGVEPGQTKWGECSGSLISETFVVTAAHCVVRVDNKEPVMVRLGKIDLEGDADNTPSQNIPVKEVIVHPEYQHVGTLNDIALLKLATPAVFTEYVKPVCLNTDEDIQSGLIVAGWGIINTTTEETSRFLQMAYVSPYDLNKCNETYFDSSKSRKILPTQLCALSLNETRQDACQGDSGGPIQIGNRQSNDKTPFILVGITSFGRSCATPTPSVYTRISEFVGWIESKVWP
ncbi:hypothetical protein Trydic_g9868 [Trypoxylus dichotomus]